MSKTHVKNWTLFFDSQEHAETFIKNKCAQLKMFGVPYDDPNLVTAKSGDLYW